MSLRLAADQMRDLDKAARYCGQTKQAFVEAAVLAEIANVKERRREKKIERKDLPQHRSTTDGTRPAGLGIVNRMRAQQGVMNEPAPAAPPPVVVNVGGPSATASGDVIERLSAYIFAGDEFERRGRIKTATEVLHSSVSTDEERKVLAARLDESIATKSKVAEGNMLRTARVAFDKLTGIFGGSE